LEWKWEYNKNRVKIIMNFRNNFVEEPVSSL
jgi:hypothetical protein